MLQWSVSEKKHCEIENFLFAIHFSLLLLCCCCWIQLAKWRFRHKPPTKVQWGSKYRTYLIWLTNYWKIVIRAMTWIKDRTKISIQAINLATFDLSNKLLFHYSGHEFKKGPHDEQTKYHNLNTELVWYSDPHCIWIIAEFFATWDLLRI